MALLAFKIMDDPFVGTITFCRIYSGTLISGTGVINSTKERKERIGRMLLMHANNREDIKEAYAGDIVALAGLKEARTGDTLCDPKQAGDPGKDGIPRAGDRDRDRAEVEGRPGKARRRAGEARGRGSVLPRLDRSGERPDHPQGHGRTASRHQGRHPQAHLQGRRQYRRAAGGLSREDHQAGRQSTTPTRSRPAVPASSRRSRSSSSRCRAGHGLRVRERDRRRRGAEGIHPRRREGPRIGARLRRARRLPGGRSQGDADRRRLSRRRLVGARLRNRLARGACAKRCRRAARSCSSRS